MDSHIRHTTDIHSIQMMMMNIQNGICCVEIIFYWLNTRNNQKDWKALTNC